MWFAPLGTIPVCQCHLQHPSHHSGCLPGTACHTGDAKLKWVPASACLSSFAVCLASIYLIMPFSLSFLKCRVRAVFIEMKGLPMFRAIIKQEMKTCLRESGSNSTTFPTSFFWSQCKPSAQVEALLSRQHCLPSLCSYCVPLCGLSRHCQDITLLDCLIKWVFLKVGVHIVL